MPHEHPTMQEIAEVAGVSKMTVSRALRNDPKISSTTKLKISRICQQMDYQPDARLSELMSHLRRSRKKRSTETIAFIKILPSQDTGAPWFTEKRQVSGCYQRAEELGLRLDEFEWIPGKLTVASMIRMLEARGIRGTILQVCTNPPQGMEAFYSRFATANLDATLPILHHVHADHFQGMTLAVDNLWRKGYRRIGFFLLERVKEWTADVWKAAFTYQMMKHGAFDPKGICTGSSVQRSTVLSWMESYNPDVIISHIPALDIIKLLRDNNYRIPEDIGVATVEWMSRYPDCAGVDQKSENVGASVVDIIARQLAYNEKGQPPYAKKVLVEGQWYDGLSVRNVVRNPSSKLESSASRLAIAS